MMHRILLSGSRFLRLLLVHEKNPTNLENDYNQLASYVKQLSKASFNNDLVKYYVEECLRLLYP